MVPKLAQRRPQKAQNHGWGPQIGACGTLKHHNGSGLIAEPSAIVTLMNSPCLDWRVRTGLVGAQQQLWFSGGKRSNWIWNSVWSSGSINSGRGTTDPFVAPLNTLKGVQTNLTSACFDREWCQNWPNDVRKRAKMTAGDHRLGRAAPSNTATAVF